MPSIKRNSYYCSCSKTVKKGWHTNQANSLTRLTKQMAKSRPIRISGPGGPLVVKLLHINNFIISRQDDEEDKGNTGIHLAPSVCATVVVLKLSLP